MFTSFVFTAACQVTSAISGTDSLVRQTAAEVFDSLARKL